MHPTMLALAVALLLGRVAGEFSNTMELESVTTFYTCTEAFPEGFNDPFAREACVAEDAPLTAIRYLVRPGEDDSAGGSAMAFFAYPPPFASQPVNEDTSGPPDNPCAFSSVTQNCTAFGGTNNETGAITLEAKATHVAQKYYLRKILGGNHAPYTYTEHKLPVPRVNNELYTCVNHCDSEIDDPECEPGKKENKGASFLIGCSTLSDFDVYPCGDTRPGSMYTPAAQFSHYSPTCGIRDSHLLANNGDTVNQNPFGPITSPPEACRSCAATYTKATRPEANQRQGNDHGVLTDDTGCQLIQMQTDDTPNVTPILHPTLCPTGIGHVGGYPGVTNDLHSHGEGATDGYSLEPYYYWCQSQCVGDGSYTQKDVFELHQTHEDCSIGGFSFGNTPGTLDTFLNLGGETQWNYNQYLNAYLCSMNPDTCPEVNFAHSVDDGGFPCCNSTFVGPGPTPGGYFVDKCNDPYVAPPDPGPLDGQANCGGIAAEQVRNAVNYLTAACDAMDSGESYCPDCASNYFMGSTSDSGPGQANQVIRDTGGNLAGDPTYTHGWQCPGWSFDHIRPSISMTSTVQLAKCSLECQSDPFIRWQVDHSDNDCTNTGDTSCWAYVEEVTSERAIIELGAGCYVYEVVPEPILEIGIELTLTSPAGTQKASFLSNAGVASSIATVELDGVNFTHRMNQAFTRGGFAPQIPGLIVICGHETGGIRDPADYCCVDEDMGGTPTGGCDTSGSYNPYDPDPEKFPNDADIKVDYPLDDPFCTSGERIGAVRSAFPYGYMQDGSSVGIEVPQMNPWPQLVRKMVQSRMINGHLMPDETDNGGGIGNEMFACHVPSQRYLGVLNCGYPVYWYYVPPERKTSYGTDCGKVGINNDYIQTGGGDRMMCMQGDSSCTPGYGEPQFAADGAPFYRTPCQELGDMIKTSMNVTAKDGTVISCSKNAVIPNAFDMPGFQYLTLDSDSSTFYPNTWIHGDAGSLFLYQQAPLAEQQNVLIDISTYTDSYYGGNVQTYTDGILTLGPGNSTVCFATANEQPGILVVGVVNTNQAHPGQYLVTLECENVQNGDSLTGDPTPSEQFSPAGGSDILVDVAAGDTVYVSWEVFASGTVPNSTDTDSPTNLSTAIGIPKCKTTLLHGGGDFAKLYELTVSCVAIAASIAAPSRNTELDQTIIQVATCKEYQFFCWLSRHGPIEEGEILVISILIGIFGIVLCICNCRLLKADIQAQGSKKALIKQYKGLETAREERQAAMTAKAIQARQARAAQASANT